MEYNVLIKDIFNIDVFKDAEIVAGKNGRNNQIASISVLEVTGKEIELWVLEDQLYITSFYAIIQDLKEQKEVIKTLQRNKAAGLVICHIDLFLKEIHPEIIQLCNELNFPLIVANSERSYIEILNPILLKLTENDSKEKFRNLINMQDRLIRYISTQGDLDYIYRTMTNEYGKKVFFLDNNDHIIYPAYHPSEKIPSLIFKHYPKVMEDASMGNKEYVIINDKDLKAIVYPITTNGVQHGSIVVEYAADDNISVSLHLLRSMASICTLIFTQTSRIRELDNIRKQEYISDLITWNFRSDEIAIKRGLEINWNIVDKNRLLLINLNDLQLSSLESVMNLEKFINEVLYDGIKQIVKQNNKKNLIGQRSDTFIILLELEEKNSYQEAKALGEKILNYCLDTFKGSVSIGISSPIKNHRDIPEAYKEAMDAAKMGRFFIHDNHVSVFEDLGFYGILRDMQRMNKFKEIRNSIFQSFQEHDEDNKMDLYKTLKVLIYHDMNTEKAAETLFLHRNSINYRKRKIVEILGYEPWKMPHLLNTILCIVSDYFD